MASCYRRASACICMSLLSVLLLVVMPCTTGAVVAAEDNTLRSYVDYFIGDLFQKPSSLNRNMEPNAQPPRFRPWQFIDVPDDSVLAFDCAGDVPMLRVVPRSDDRTVINNNDGAMPLTDNTCGGGVQAAGTAPMHYKFTHVGGGNDTRGYCAFFWGQPSSVGEKEGEDVPPALMPVPKFQLKAILKAVAALMDASWRKERGDGVMSDSVAFSADMVVFYVNIDPKKPWLVAMGWEDVEFRQPWEKLDGKIKALDLGTVVV